MLNAQVDKAAAAETPARDRARDRENELDAQRASDGVAQALATLLRALAAQDYRFVTTTPLTHQRILSRRAGDAASTLRDVFGWNMQFDQALLGAELLDAMGRAGALLVKNGRMQSAVRVSTIGEQLFLHSAYPTLDDDAVFFGPDTYRFVRFMEQALASEPGQPGRRPPSPLRLLDVGCGSGAGAVMLAQWLGRRGIRTAATMNDINPRALRLAAVNAQVAGVAATLALGDALNAVAGQFDLIISNPPYMADPRHRAYRDGGAGLGRALSVSIVAQALPRLASGGRLLMYTGVAMTGGIDPFLREVSPLLEAAGCEWSYGEIDPDVFGEELESPDYAQAERIAAVGLIARRGLDA